MSFKTGSISFRIFKLSRPFHIEDLSDKLAAQALPPLHTLCEESIRGWCGHNHMQDRPISGANTMLGGFLHFQLVTAQRKVQASILQSECIMEEKAVMEAEGKDYLNQSARSEIRKQVKERLLPDQQPTLKAIELVVLSDEYVVATATSEAQLDALVLSLMQTTGIALNQLDPDEAAIHLAGVDVRDFPAKSLSSEIPDCMSDITAGREFLTWLWYCSEKRGGLVNVDDVGEVAFMVEGPLDFVMDGRGAHEIIIKKGQPMLAAESKAALLSGKTLKSARIIFARGEEVWNFMLDADQFVFKGLKLPQTESFDTVGKFQERMILLETFRHTFFHLYASYLNDRMTKWDHIAAQIQQWVAERPGE